MSKQSSRRRKKAQQPSHLIGLGMKALKQGNFDQAIRAWTQVQSSAKASPELSRALAEAYFRRAVTDPHGIAANGSNSRLADLQQATRLSPTDTVYRYHLALTYHRQGQLEQAEPIYRQLLTESPPYKRAAVPLAQLLVERNNPLTTDPVWEQLDQHHKIQFEVIQALSTKKGPSALPDSINHALEPLWQGLLAVALDDDRPKAKKGLQVVAAASDQSHQLRRGMAHYYLGVLAARDNQLDQAESQWQNAWSNKLNTAHLRNNITTLLYPKVIEEHQSNRLTSAFNLLSPLKDIALINNNLAALFRQIALEMGYSASQRANWGQALHYWEVAQKAGEDSRGLTLNLALGYQHLERHYEAAEQWRTLLRRRPRKATHPEAMSDDKVARVWQNVAENYAKAGDYDEAVKTYKNAVKWAPDNVDLRLKLVDALQSEGRWQAAENELNRILEKEPDHVPALIMLAESYSEDFFSMGAARHLWQRVLELEPQNPIARQQLAYGYIKEGSYSSQWGNHDGAIRIFKEGLKSVPDSQQLHVVIGGTYADKGDFDATLEYFEKALAINPDDLQSLFTIFSVWLEYDFEPFAKETLERIKAVGSTVPSPLFLELVNRCLDMEADEFAESLLEYIREQYPDDDKAMMSVALHYADLNQEQQAVPILRRIIKNQPDHAEANLRLGSIYYKIGQSRLANRHWDKAEQLAKAENNQVLLYDLKMAKDLLVHGKPPPRNPLEMLQGMPPEVRQQMLSELPPEVAEILNMNPDMLEMMMGFNFMDNFDDDDEDDFDDFF